MSELKNAISTNEKLKLDINNRLQKNRKQADALRQELATRANSHERRTLMELEYRVLKVSFFFCKRLLMSNFNFFFCFFFLNIFFQTLTTPNFFYFFLVFLVFLFFIFKKTNRLN